MTDREFDPYSDEFFEDPWDMYRWLRDEQPCYHNERLGFWAVSRYDDCVEVHRDHEAFTSTRGVSLDQLRSAAFGELAVGFASMIMLDPPEHDRMRKLVNRAFTPRRIAEWEPVVQQVIDARLDTLAGAGHFDVVRDFSGPFPVEIISAIVGIPSADRQQIRHWADAMLEREIGNPLPTAAGIEASIAFWSYVQALVLDKRANPSDDMIGHLIEAEVPRDDGTTEHLTDDEVTGFITLLTAAGSETATKLVANAVMTLAEHPGELARLRADWSLAPAAVEEALRWRAPSQYQGRFAVADRTLHGRTIPAGSPVLIVTGAANRDPRAYDDPDRFDITRQGPLGIAFGHGVHYCIGSHLARLEGRIALESLYGRWPELKVDLDAVRWVHMANVAGPASVPVSV
jgi:cytochrome P450